MQESEDLSASSPGGQATFNATFTWQDVPDGAILPGGLQIEADVTTGRKRARKLPAELIARIVGCAPLAELRGLKQWVCWRYEMRAGKLTKPPFKPDGNYASSIKPRTWTTFERAADAFVNGKHGFDGIGIMMNKELVGTDFDDCLSPEGKITSDLASWIVERLDSYCEITPSGQGLRVIVRGSLPPGARKCFDGPSEVAIYQDGRYLTITADAINDLPIREVGPELLGEIVAAIAARQTGGATKPNGAGSGSAEPEPEPEPERLIEALIEAYPELAEIWHKRCAPPKDSTPSGWDLKWAGAVRRLGFNPAVQRASTAAFRRHQEAGQPPDGSKSKADRPDYLARTVAAAARTRAPDDVETEPPPGRTVRWLPLSDWSAATAYANPAPAQTFLVEPTVPLGVPMLLAAAGGVGKSGLALDWCWRVASGHGIGPILGGQVVAPGAAVMLTSEDSKDTVHRRLEALAGGDLPENLIVVPLPSAGGPFSLVKREKDGTLHNSSEFEWLLGALEKIPDLRLLVFDPLQLFSTNADITADPAGAQFVLALLGTLAAETSATVCALHHMRKSEKPILTLADARLAVRGTSGLIDAVRVVYTLWEPDPEDKVAAELCAELEAEGLVYGGVCKANDVKTGALHIYRRDAHGWLSEVTESAGALGEKIRAELANRVTPEQEEEAIIAIASEARAGRPLARTGENGVYSRREVLPEWSHKLSRAKLLELVDGLLKQGKLVQAQAKGAKATKWLDAPDGPFARGHGKFEEGAKRT